MEVQVPVSAPSGLGWWFGAAAKLGDERLVRMAAAGNERAFAAIYQRYHQQLYRYCRSIVQDEADAQDALQSTFLRALAALQRGHPDAPLRPWLFRIAHNESITLLRRRRPQAELGEAPDALTASIEEQAGGRAQFALLVRDLHDLPARQRSALVMRELSGLSHEEIASALGVSVGAAKQTIFEARRSLLEFAEGRSMVCEDVQRAVSHADGRTLRGRRLRAHLRDCGACAAFAAVIPQRSAELRALAPPLPAGIAAGILARLLTPGSGHGGAGAAAAATGTAGKTMGAVLTAKTVAGVAVIAAATVGASVELRAVVEDSGPAAVALHHAGAHAAAATSSGAAGGVAGPGAGGGVLEQQAHRAGTGRAPSALPLRLASSGAAAATSATGSPAARGTTHAQPTAVRVAPSAGAPGRAVGHQGTHGGSGASRSRHSAAVKRGQSQSQAAKRQSSNSGASHRSGAGSHGRPHGAPPARNGSGHARHPAIPGLPSTPGSVVPPAGAGKGLGGNSPGASRAPSVPGR
jgi:RNA polymerase sigma factor (sigma-70 family)